MSLALVPSLLKQSSAKWAPIFPVSETPPHLLPGWGSVPRERSAADKVLYTKSRRVRNRAATGLRIGAQSLHHANDYLGEFFRQIARRLGKPQAITATADKLARIVFHLLNTKEPYDESVFQKPAITRKPLKTR